MSIGTWIQQSRPTLTFIVCASLILFLRSMPCNCPHQPKWAPQNCCCGCPNKHDHVHCLPWRRPAHPGCQDLFPAGHFLDSARQVLWWRHQSNCPDPASTVQNAAILVSSVLHLCSGVFWRSVQSWRTPNLDFTVVSRPRVWGGWLTLYLYIRASLCSALG